MKYKIKLELYNFVDKTTNLWQKEEYAKDIDEAYRKAQQVIKEINDLRADEIAASIKSVDPIKEN